MKSSGDLGQARFCFPIVRNICSSLFLLSMLFGSALLNVFSPEGTPVYDIARRGFLMVNFKLNIGWVLDIMAVNSNIQW